MTSQNSTDSSKTISDETVRGDVMPFHSKGGGATFKGSGDLTARIRAKQAELKPAEAEQSSIKTTYPTELTPERLLRNNPFGTSEEAEEFARNPPPPPPPEDREDSSMY